jgi:hypothetical protein
MVRQPRKVVYGPVIWLLWGEVGVGPAEEDDQTVAEADQEGDVDGEPGKPREPSRHLPAEQIAHRGSAADDREGALVDITEGRGGASRGQGQNVLCRVPSRLHRGRADAGHRGAVLLDGREVSGHEDVGRAGDREVRVHDHLPGAVEFHPQRPREA